MAENKTNAMRTLERMGIAHRAQSYPCPGGAVNGQTAAALLGAPPERVFKTLVTRGAGGGYYVFAVPVGAALDLKAAARAVGEKSVEMIRQTQLLPLTGYVHGGCSPVGMKKRFPTVLDGSAQDFSTIFVSAGKIGVQVELAPADLLAATGGVFAPVAKAETQQIEKEST